MEISNLTQSHYWQPQWELQESLLVDTNNSKRLCMVDLNKTIVMLCEMLGSYGGEYDRYCFLGCDTVQCGRKVPTFGGTCWLHLQGRRVSNAHICSFLIPVHLPFLLHQGTFFPRILLYYTEDGGRRLLWNIGIPTHKVHDVTSQTRIILISVLFSWKIRNR
jgi:hypothetical protein